jgi:FMN phosphatase YigB (HAD superfamily)
MVKVSGWPYAAHMLVKAAALAPFNQVTPITSVLFDFHSTLVDQGDSATWLNLALARAPHDLNEPDRAALLSFLDRIWENARVLDPESSRDLGASAHARVFHELLAQGPAVDPTLADALYESLLDTWVAYDDAGPTLLSLKEAGIKIGILSNVGVSIHHVLEREGLAQFADGLVLSYEVGSVKPDLAIFQASLDSIGSTAAETLMVGDSGHDDVGGTALGMRTLVLPRTRGRNHGLAVVVGLVLASR